jgi:hypothetical protein
MWWGTMSTGDRRPEAGEGAVKPHFLMQGVWRPFIKALVSATAPGNQFRVRSDRMRALFAFFRSNRAEIADLSRR